MKNAVITCRVTSISFTEHKIPQYLNMHVYYRTILSKEVEHSVNLIEIYAQTLQKNSLSLSVVVMATHSVSSFTHYKNQTPIKATFNPKIK